MGEPSSAPSATEQKHSSGAPDGGKAPPASASGRRPAFSEIRRELTPDELSNPGAQKLVLEMLERAEAERDALKDYEKMFHDADKRVGILEEKQKTNRVNEVLTGVGFSLGGSIIGLAPFFWTHPTPSAQAGPIALGIGSIMVIGSGIARIVFK